jgi:hypothetical protein
MQGVCDPEEEHSMSTNGHDHSALKMFEAWQKTVEKFDYFVVGGAGALCAFVANKWTPERLAFSPNTLELIALLLLIASVIAGFKRLERFEMLLRANHRMLQLDDAARDHAAAGRAAEADREWSSACFFRDEIQKSERPMRVWYNLRNWLLLTGFLLLVVANVWTPYFEG